MSNGEIRIPNKLLSSALKEKKVKALRLLASAKLKGHRASTEQLFQELKLHPKTGKRLIDSVVSLGWAGTDGKFLFARSWHKLDLSKRGGLYLTQIHNLKKFEALCFAKALKKLYRKPGGQTTGKRKDHAKDFPARYLAKSLGLKQRRFEMLKASAQRYRFISVRPQYNIIGTAKDFPALKKNLHGMPVFKRGRHTVVPDIAKIKVLI
jgi:hypothetical protein